MVSLIFLYFIVEVFDIALLVWRCQGWEIILHGRPAASPRAPDHTPYFLAYAVTFATIAVVSLVFQSRTGFCKWYLGLQRTFSMRAFLYHLCCHWIAGAASVKTLRVFWQQASLATSNTWKRYQVRISNKSKVRGLTFRIPMRACTGSLFKSSAKGGGWKFNARDITDSIQSEKTYTFISVRKLSKYGASQLHTKATQFRCHTS